MKCNRCRKETNYLLNSSMGPRLCWTCAKDAGWEFCQGCNTLHPPYELDYVYSRGHYCAVCIKDRFTACSNCTDFISNDDIILFEGMPHCQRCHDDMDFDRDESHVCDSYVKTNSSRCYGIEIETNYCPKYQHFYSDPRWGAKVDDSIEGKEFDSAKFRGDCGLKAVEDLCSFAKDNNWGADEECGLHVHVDISKVSCAARRAIAYAYNNTIDIWETFVSENRADNGWCRHDKFRGIERLITKEDWREYTKYLCRYQWVNLVSYDRHGTIEIRSHEGTLDAKAICNWTRAHLIFVDWAVSTGCKRVKEMLTGDQREVFETLCDIWTHAGAPDLVDYYKTKSRQLQYA